MRTLIGMFMLMAIAFTMTVSQAVADGPNTTKEQYSYDIGEVDNTFASIEVAEAEAYGRMVSDCVSNQELGIQESMEFASADHNSISSAHLIAEKHETHTYLNAEARARHKQGIYNSKPILASNVFDNFSNHSGKNIYRC